MTLALPVIALAQGSPATQSPRTLTPASGTATVANPVPAAQAITLAAAPLSVPSTLNDIEIRRSQALAAAPTPVPSTVSAAPVSSAQTNDAGTATLASDVQIVTDETDANGRSGDFSMPHHVRFERPGTTVVGDSAHGNYRRAVIAIQGHVRLNDDGRGVVGAADAGGGPPEAATLACDVLTIAWRERRYDADGNVAYAQGQRRAQADRGGYDQRARTLTLDGRVALAEGDRSLHTTAFIYHYDSGAFDARGEGTRFAQTGSDATAQTMNGNLKQGHIVLSGDVVVHDDGRDPRLGTLAAGEKSPATLSADQVTIERDEQHYVASGHVHFTQGDRKAVADHAVLDEARHILTLDGAVMLDQGGATLRARHLTYNTRTRDVHAVGAPRAPIEIHEPIPPGAPGTSPTTAPKQKHRFGL